MKKKKIRANRCRQGWECGRECRVWGTQVSGCKVFQDTSTGVGTELPSCGVSGCRESRHISGCRVSLSGCEYRVALGCKHARVSDGARHMRSTV